MVHVARRPSSRRTAAALGTGAGERTPLAALRGLLHQHAVAVHDAMRSPGGDDAPAGRLMGDDVVMGDVAKDTIRRSVVHGGHSASRTSIKPHAA
jgi:hypothetical protein